MPAPTVADAKKSLGPYHSMIRQIIDDAWAECRAVQKFRDEKGFGTLLYSRTLSNDMFDAIARRAIVRLGAKASVFLVLDAQTFKFHVKGTLARIKRGDEDNLGSNHPTQTALAFEDADCAFPGFPPDTAKVEIIWTPNDLLTKIDHVLVVARDGDKLIWQYEIPANEGSGIVEPMPVKPVDPTTGGSNLIKPKSGKAKKDEAS